ncbi:Sphingosine kinase 2, partial [Geodia barretti]
MAEGGGEEEAAVRSTSAFLLASSGSGRRVKSPPPSATRVRLLLTRERLECSDEKQQQDHKATVTSGFLLEDLVGVDVRGRPPPHDKNACEMNVHFYPKQTEKKKTMRKMKVLSVCFDKAETLSENRAEASKWKDDIKLYSHYRRSQVLKIEDGEVQADGVPQRRLLVLINPISGQGKAVQDFQEHVQPLFELAEITFNAIVTERQNHARELMKEYDLSTVDGIVIASGDGLLYEVQYTVCSR